MSALDLDALKQRFLARLLNDWPERDIPEGVIRSELEISVREAGSTYWLEVLLLGHATAYEIDGSQSEADEAVESMASTIAWDLEGDRWIYGDGWREYRS